MFKITKKDEIVYEKRITKRILIFFIVNFIILMITLYFVDISINLYSFLMWLCLSIIANAYIVTIMLAIDLHIFDFPDDKFQRIDDD